MSEEQNKTPESSNDDEPKQFQVMDSQSIPIMGKKIFDAPAAESIGDSNDPNMPRFNNSADLSAIQPEEAADNGSHRIKILDSQSIPIIGGVSQEDDVPARRSNNISNANPISILGGNSTPATANPLQNQPGAIPIMGTPSTSASATPNPGAIPIMSTPTPAASNQPTAIPIMGNATPVTNSTPATTSQPGLVSITGTPITSNPTSPTTTPGAIPITGNPSPANNAANPPGAIPIMSQPVNSPATKPVSPNETDPFGQLPGNDVDVAGDVTVARIPIMSSSATQAPSNIPVNIPVTETTSRMPAFNAVLGPSVQSGELTRQHRIVERETPPTTPSSAATSTGGTGFIQPSTQATQTGAVPIQPSTSTPQTGAVPIQPIAGATPIQPSNQGGDVTNQQMPNQQPETQIPVWLATSATSTRFVPNLTPAQQIRRALSLSSVLVELRGRVVEARLRGPDAVVPNGNASDGFWLASTWRGLFSRAISLHTELLGDFEVRLERYNMSFGKPRYLNAGFAFINIGIDPTSYKFQIAEKLRQTLNFLTCLYQKHELYEHIVEEVYTGDDPFLVLPAVEEGKPIPDRYLHLINDLTSQVETLLIAWDSYVRERLFATSSTMLAARYAYFAGRALTELTWNMTIKYAPLRRKELRDGYSTPYDLANEVYQYWIEAFHPQNIGYIQRELSALVTTLEEEYMSSSGKTVQAKPDEKTKEPMSEQETDLHSPRAAINCVIQSLEYWQTTVIEMSKEGVLQRITVKDTSDYRELPSWNGKVDIHADWTFENLLDMRQALIEQWGGWFALVSGRQDLTSFRAVNVASELLQDYSQQITRLASTNLQDAFHQMQAEMRELAQTGLEATKDVARVGINALADIFKSKWLWIGAGSVIILVGVIALVLMLASGSRDFTTFLGSVLSAILGALGIGGPGYKAVRDGQIKVATSQEKNENTISNQNTNSQKKMEESVNVGALVLTTVGHIRDYLEAAFTRGYDQLQKEMGLISAALAVSSPLVEFVTRNADTNNDLEFLSTVIWNDKVRRSQLNRIVIAAFGPVGAFFIASQQEKEKDREQIAEEKIRQFEDRNYKMIIDQAKGSVVANLPNKTTTTK